MGTAVSLGQRNVSRDMLSIFRSTSPNTLGDSPIAPKPVKPHDWTYSTCYAGSSTPGFSPSDQHEIPVKLLARQDPVLDQILFYEDVPLFEDELHDHGESILNVRIVRSPLGTIRMR